MPDKDDDAFLSEPIKWTGPSQFELWQLDQECALGLIGPLPEKENRERLAEIREKKEQAETLVFLQKIQKLALLLKWHKLEMNPDGLFHLCLLLCCKFYPGFSVQVEEKRGRKKKWDSARYFELVSAIFWIKKEKNMGTRQACRVFLRRENKKRPSEVQVRSLEARYSEALNPKHNIFAKMCTTGDAAHDAYMLEQIALHFRK